MTGFSIFLLTEPTGGVGGIAELPEVAGAPLDIPGESSGNMGVLVGLAASSAAGLLALGGVAWYARRRWQR